MKKLIFFLIFICSINIQSQWIVQPSGITTSLRSVKFYNQNKGLTVGLGGKILKTTNGGLIWSVVNSGTTQDLYSVSYTFNFQDSLTVFACGANGTIIRSTDGGTSWVQAVSGISSALRSIMHIRSLVYNFFLAVGDNGVIIDSQDGISWSRDTSMTTRQLNSEIYFGDGNSGFVAFVAGNTGTMLKSAYAETDLSNLQISIDATFPVTSNNLLGMAVTYIYPPYQAVYFACSDGGKIFKTRINITPWTQINSGVSVPLRSMSAAYKTGKVWAVGDNGNIRYSADTGNTWTGQNSLTATNLYSIFMLDSIHGWIVGDGGTISNTINGGGPIGIQQISTNIPANFSLSQNYPNPFNPSTNINFAIQKSSFVNITIFDITGREIETIVNEKLNAGTYNANWEATKYSSGVYFYKLEAGDFIETKKMILNK